jgi:type III secretory pathway component EscV
VKTLRAQTNIIVEIGSAVGVLTKTTDGGTDLAERIRATTQDWLDALSLPVDANVRLTQVNQPRGPQFIDIAVILNGVRCGFSKRQLAQAYESSTRREVADHAAGVKAARELLAEAAAKKDKSLAMGQALLAELVLEAVKTSAERLITLKVTEALLARARAASTASRPAVKELDRGLATEVLRRLTSVHVAVQDAPAFARSVFAGQSDGLTATDIAEQFFDLWRARTIEIHVDLSLAKKILRDDPVVGTAYPAAELALEPANLLALMCDGLFYELGVWFAQISIVPDAALSVNCCRFRLNQRLTPVLHSVAEDELLVNDTAERLTAEGIPDARPRANPANGNLGAIISRRFKRRLPPEHDSWDQFEYIVLLLSTELRLAASTLLSLDDVKDLLGKLNSAFPALVVATLHQYSLLDVAQVLRWLLRDGVSIRDLRSVLELMLDFSYTTGVRSPTAGWGGREPYVFVGAEEFTGEPYFTDDSPYVPQFDMNSMQLYAEPAPEWIANGRILAEFVKCGMRQYLTHKMSRGQNTIICYLVDAEIEKRLLAFRAAPEANSPPFSEWELADMLKGIGESFVESYVTPVLFLATTPDIALLVQDMIGQDFPEVTVLHRQSVAESANVQPIATVPGSKTAPPVSRASE